MKKNIILFIAALIIAIIPLSFVRAAEVKTLYIYQDVKDIVIKGSTDENVMAVSIEIYNEDETEFIKKLVVYVSDDYKYETRINIDNGTYTIKVADYDGGEYKESSFKKEDPFNDTVPAATEETPDTTKTPETSDKIFAYLSLLSISIVGIILSIKYRKLNN